MCHRVSTCVVACQRVSLRVTVCHVDYGLHADCGSARVAAPRWIARSRVTRDVGSTQKCPGSLTLVQQARRSRAQVSQVHSVLALAGDVMGELGRWLQEHAARAPSGAGGAAPSQPSGAASNVPGGRADAASTPQSVVDLWAGTPL